jgi:ribosomal protein S27E
MVSRPVSPEFPGPVIYPRKQDECPDCSGLKERKSARCRDCYEKNRAVVNTCACGTRIDRRAKRCRPCGDKARRKTVAKAPKLSYYRVQLLESEHLELVEVTLSEISVKCTECSNSYVFPRHEEETWACVACDRVKVMAWQLSPGRA